MHAWSHHGAPMDLQIKSHIWDPRALIMPLCVDIRNSNRNYACVSICMNRFVDNEQACNRCVRQSALQNTQLDERMHNSMSEYKLYTKID